MSPKEELSSVIRDNIYFCIYVLDLKEGKLFH